MLGITVLSGCTTVYQEAPKNESYSSEPVTFVNAQIDTTPRVFFSDGITTLKTGYKGWVDNIISNLSMKINNVETNRTLESASFEISLHAIQCTGHYVPECNMTVYLTDNENYKKVFTSGEVNSYPVQNSMNKAINVTTDKIMADNEFLQLIYK